MPRFSGARPLGVEPWRGERKTGGRWLTDDRVANEEIGRTAETHNDDYQADFDLPREHVRCLFVRQLSIVLRF